MKIAGGRGGGGGGGRGEKLAAGEKRRRTRRECGGVRKEGLKRRRKGRRGLEEVAEPTEDVPVSILIKIYTEDEGGRGAGDPQEGGRKRREGGE